MTQAMKLTEYTFDESISGAYDQLQESRLIVEAGGDLDEAMALVKEAERRVKFVRFNAKTDPELVQLHKAFKDIFQARVLIAEAYNEEAGV